MDWLLKLGKGVVVQVHNFVIFGYGFEYHTDLNKNTIAEGGNRQPFHENPPP